MYVYIYIYMYIYIDIPLDLHARGPRASADFRNALFEYCDCALLVYHDCRGWILAERVCIVWLRGCI